MPVNNCRCGDSTFFSNEDVDRILPQLARKESSQDSWDEIYECPECRSRWELSYDGVGGQCCGIEKLLRKISTGRNSG